MDSSAKETTEISLLQPLGAALGRTSPPNGRRWHLPVVLGGGGTQCKVGRAVPKSSQREQQGVQGLVVQRKGRSAPGAARSLCPCPEPYTLGAATTSGDPQIHSELPANGP